MPLPQHNQKREQARAPLLFRYDDTGCSPLDGRINLLPGRHGPRCYDSWEILDVLASIARAHGADITLTDPDGTR